MTKRQIWSATVALALAFPVGYFATDRVLIAADAAQPAPPATPYDWQRAAQLLQQQRDQAQKRADDVMVDAQVTRENATKEAAQAAATAKWWQPVWAALVAAKHPTAAAAAPPATPAPKNPPPAAKP